MSNNFYFHNTADWRSEFKRLEGAYAPAAMKSHHTDVRIFAEWCGERALCALPADSRTVCALLEDQAELLAPASFQRRLFAIRKAHRLLALSDPTWDEDINLTLRRVRRAKLNRPRQAKGMTRPHLDKCLAAQPDDRWGLRNRAISLNETRR